jgi:tetratricopeptide (TPR) repeat protein
MKAVRKYVELVPDHPNPYDSYGELLQWDGRFEDAATQYRNAVQRDQAFNAAYFGLAEIARLTGRTSDIPGLIEQGIQYAPTTQARINARRALANHYLMQGKRNAAMTELATVAEEAAANDIDWLTTLAHQQLALAAAMSGRCRHAPPGGRRRGGGRHAGAARVGDVGVRRGGQSGQGSHPRPAARGQGGRRDLEDGLPRRQRVAAPA